MREMILINQQNGSDKEYRFDMNRERTVVTKYSGKRGASGVVQGQMSIVGLQARGEFEAFVKSKLKKGYRINSVGGKPFMGGSAADAIAALLDGHDNTSQAPIARKIKKVEVAPQVMAGQMVPIW
jgi:hypothetical protein